MPQSKRCGCVAEHSRGTPGFVNSAGQDAATDRWRSDAEDAGCLAAGYGSLSFRQLTGRATGGSRQTCTVLMPLIVLLVLVAVALLCAVRPRGWYLLVLAFLSLAWLLVDDPVEGPGLLRLSASHGVTVADLAVPLAWALVAAGWLRSTYTGHMPRAATSTEKPSH